MTDKTGLAVWMERQLPRRPLHLLKRYRRCTRPGTRASLGKVRKSSREHRPQAHNAWIIVKSLMGRKLHGKEEEPHSNGIGESNPQEGHCSHTQDDTFSEVRAVVKCPQTQNSILLQPGSSRGEPPWGSGRECSARPWITLQCFPHHHPLQDWINKRFRGKHPENSVI